MFARVRVCVRVCARVFLFFLLVSACNVFPHLYKWRCALKSAKWNTITWHNFVTFSFFSLYKSLMTNHPPNTMKKSPSPGPGPGPDSRAWPTKRKKRHNSQYTMYIYDMTNGRNNTFLYFPRPTNRNLYLYLYLYGPNYTRMIINWPWWLCVNPADTVNDDEVNWTNDLSVI